MNKKIPYIILFALIAVAIALFAASSLYKNNTTAPSTDSSIGRQFSSGPDNSQTQNLSADQNTGSFQSPLDRAAERVAKKPFGIFITPQDSPVRPEKFRGYHTGTDFEIFPEELDADVPVRAICSGTIAAKKTASGYGGVLVQNCEFDNQPITVVYGHLKLASISKDKGDALTVGNTIGILGKAYSTETDGERKHLHLGIRKGRSINILGYVHSQSQLLGWIDACTLVCQ